MAEALFYHLTESRLEDALPMLLERSIARGWKVVVQSGSEERRDALDAHLWAYSDDSFLAHGVEHDAHAERQPILLTVATDNPNQATVRFLVDGAEPGDDVAGYERLIFMFDGHDDGQVETARRHWKTVKDSGFSATYWQQKSPREWERKA